MRIRSSLASWFLGAGLLLGSAGIVEAQALKPNIVLVLTDNLGYGEIGINGASRMVPTPRIDQLAAEGLRLTNFNTESECTPSRAALLTGRYPVRSGVYKSAPPGQPQGLTQWEITLAELLSAQGYATAHYGKWHLGAQQGRLPTDQGFDEWYGVPRTSDEANFTSAEGFDPAAAPTPHILEGRKGQAPRPVKVFDHASRRTLDRELVDRSLAFLERQAKAQKPFFLYVPLTQVHFPTLPHPEFEGKSGAGRVGDAIAEMDRNVGVLADAIKRLGLEQNTILIFTSDNGPEYRTPWRGTAGPWRGTYHTAMEGSLRVPFIVRWPGRIPAGKVSNEIVHVVDLFTTLARAAGAPVPEDRPIDGVDQLGFFTGKQSKSNREGFPYWVQGKLYAAKWRDWKLHFVWFPDMEHAPEPLDFPKLFHLRADPKEEMDVMTPNTWVLAPIFKMVREFEASLKTHPLILPGTPDPYVPPPPK